MFCHKCGKNIPDEAKFCRYCGAPTGYAANPSGSQTGYAESAETVQNKKKTYDNGEAGWEYVKRNRAKGRALCAVLIAAILLVSVLMLVYLLHNDSRDLDDEENYALCTEVSSGMNCEIDGLR